MGQEGDLATRGSFVTLAGGCLSSADLRDTPEECVQAGSKQAINPARIVTIHACRVILTSPSRSRTGSAGTKWRDDSRAYGDGQHQKGGCWRVSAKPQA